MKIVFLFYSCTYGYEVYFHKSKNLYLSDMHLINNIHFALLNNYSLLQVPVSITFVFIFREIKCLSLVWAQLCLMFLLSFGGQTPVWYTYFTYHMGVQKKKIYEFFCCWRICMWRCLCFLFTTRPHQDKYSRGMFTS